MKISTRVRYGLRLLVDLAEHTGVKPVKLREVSERQEISLNYLRQLIMPLEANGMVRSIRGNRGGYVLGKSPEQVSLLEVMNLLDGPVDLVDCVKEKKLCGMADTCPTRSVWIELSQNMETTLSRKTLKDLLRGDTIPLSPH
ncbi:MAG: Rrf2 family transcriptional regulator [Candidatus Atribacteria bacterium]|nr:Rrf2 family transcriptional regulator [Candidatus Atribacteria bacterium]